MAGAASRLPHRPSDPAAGGAGPSGTAGTPPAAGFPGTSRNPSSRSRAQILLGLWARLCWRRRNPSSGPIVLMGRELPAHFPPKRRNPRSGLTENRCVSSRTQALPVPPSTSHTALIFPIRCSASGCGSRRYFRRRFTYSTPSPMSSRSAHIPYAGRLAELTEAGFLVDGQVDIGERPFLGDHSIQRAFRPGPGPGAGIGWRSARLGEIEEPLQIPGHADERPFPDAPSSPCK